MRKRIFSALMNLSAAETVSDPEEAVNNMLLHDQSSIAGDIVKHCMQSFCR